MNEVAYAVLAIVAFTMTLGLWGFVLGMGRRIKDLENKVEKIQFKLIEMSYYCEKFRETLEIKTNPRISKKITSNPAEDFKDSHS